MGKVKYTIDSIFDKRPKVKDFTLLDEELQEYIKVIIPKANPVLRIKRKQVSPRINDFWSLKWIELIEIRHDYENEDLLSIFKNLYGVTEKQLLKLDIFNYFSCIKWITDQLENIAESEKENLNYESSEEEKEAGSEEFEKYDYYVTLDGLTNGDSTKEEFYLNKSYEYIFRKLCLLNDKRMFNDKMQEIVSRKNKRN